MNGGIFLHKRSAIAWITLDRSGPAPDPELAAALREACQDMARDDEVRVVLMIGSGRSFYAPRFAIPPVDASDLQAAQRLALLRIATPVAALEKPVIAALNGPAIGQGLELALACDLRLASEEARFAMPQVQDGLMPWDGGTQRLPRVVGRAKALELLLTGREIDAQEALAMGLVHQVLPPDQLVSRAQELAERIASHAPIALRYTKEALLHGMDLGLAAGLRLEADLNIILQSTQDRAEGIRSFLEHREARFEGQ